MDSANAVHRRDRGWWRPRCSSLTPMLAWSLRLVKNVLEAGQKAAQAIHGGFVRSVFLCHFRDALMELQDLERPHHHPGVAQKRCHVRGHASSQTLKREAKRTSSACSASLRSMRPAPAAQS
eukprot:2731826-Prorocentrum_lima.AAC.1